MAYHWEEVGDREQIKDGLAKAGLMAHICWLLGVLFAIIGVISDAIDETLGLETTSWLLLSIVAFISGIFPGMGQLIIWHVLASEVKPKKED
jgi:hypothetical protein